ncbi:MAG: histidine phosphatase family protein [Microbacterium sp.]|uniref:histidine phosphatase family protein n=1 Tax=Microbacterium sp. TaxID=51671 RepID=UPI0039E25578
MGTHEERRILLVRHGRTALNAEGRLRGRADPPLDDVGIAQAEATAAALSGVGLGEAVSSPLQRAVRTAQIIAAASAVPHRVDAAFDDRDYGPWTGQVKADVVARWGGIDAAPGVEPEADVLERALRGLDALADAADAAPVAVVTHDAVIRPVLARIRPCVDAVVDTGSWAEIAREAGVWRLVSFDDTAGSSS